MKSIFTVLLLGTSLFAMEYYAKIEPLESYVIKSAVSGKVLRANDAIEGKKANNSEVVKIDSFVNEVELKETKNKLQSMNHMIELEDKNYNRLNKVRSKSAFEKDTQKIKVLSLESQRSDLLIKIAMLEDTIKNKKLMEKNNYIFDIAVKAGDYVTPGTLLYTAKDLSKGKLEIFIPIADAGIIQNKDIYLDGKKSELKIDRIYEVADAKHISSYKCEIIVPNVKKFSRLVKIEFK
jgi:hypothetical protein